jgi:hypothetical protein
MQTYKTVVAKELKAHGFIGTQPAVMAVGSKGDGLVEITISTIGLIAKLREVPPQIADELPFTKDQCGLLCLRFTDKQFTTGDALERTIKAIRNIYGLKADPWGYISEALASEMLPSTAARLALIWAETHTPPNFRLPSWRELILENNRPALVAMLGSFREWFIRTEFKMRLPAMRQILTVLEEDRLARLQRL